MFEQIGALIVLALCLALWLGMALKPARRHGWLRWPQRLWHEMRIRRRARREAAEAIERARRKPKVDREGNVYRPKSFDQRRRDDDKLH